MKSFTIAALSFILFDVFLLTSCNEEKAINILNSFLKSEKWSFNHAYKWYDIKIGTFFKTEDLLITDSKSKNIVTKDNVYDKITIGSQLLTYEYAKIVHWIGTMLYFMNKEWYTNDEIPYNILIEYLEKLILTFEKVKWVLKLFLSALEFMNTIIESHEKTITDEFIELLTDFILKSNMLKFKVAINDVALKLSFNTFSELIHTFFSTKLEAILFKCCKINGFNKNFPLDLIEYILHYLYADRLKEKPDEKSIEEFTFFVFLHETILNSVDEIIEIYYTNLGFKYEEKNEKTSMRSRKGIYFIL
ncbi:uncharacterized protein LOC126896774 [Daktulosphaira vitifoliae]|uniref:uncharacterized protein LOC126896774 n=1 Tax=Daktulosphaira vitifoliae TaxID=58002 RepID=UPI0021A9D91B|nr:uncharacterized protein LOC126896774 [Daktulosphaira vitifoliae]